MKDTESESIFRAVIAFLMVSSIIISCKRASEKQAAGQPHARSAPEWITNGIIYQVQLRAFTPGGTLKEAIDRLPRLADLGIDIIYLCPVFLADDDTDTTFWSPRQKASGMNNPRNPYRMKDYYNVDPEYGTNDDLKNFISRSHELGIRVMLDMVYLHCGPTAIFLKENPDFIKRDDKGNPINAAWAFPALNFANPGLREYLWKNMEYWVLEFNADGFRCDVASNIPLDFWETARERLEKIRPDIGMLAEGERKEDQLKAFDLNYSFTWFNAVRRVIENKDPVSNLKESWKKMAHLHPKGARFIRYSDNHDIANDDYYNRVEEVWGTECVNAISVMNFTLDGVPFIYNGQEVADTNRHSIFGRLPVNWALEETQTGKERFTFLQNLIQLRKNEPVLINGDVDWIENSSPDQVLSFSRTSGKDQIIIIINLTGQNINVSLTGLDDIRGKRVKKLLVNDADYDETDNMLKLGDYGFIIEKRKIRK